MRHRAQDNAAVVELGGLELSPVVHTRAVDWLAALDQTAALDLVEAIGRPCLGPDDEAYIGPRGYLGGLLKYDTFGSHARRERRGRLLARLIAEGGIPV